ncbi:hypothetical protein NDU88_004648 [Pleurodeles waltl]|uniref:Uncharacterized protein n=1 Tax=Pleurodeles waltl TaxID=8319 RepID=A0AAV7UFP6_PLEWA|nr:hypothetical protein NDU88_004648 [Pleurodeles waltl]
MLPGPRCGPWGRGGSSRARLTGEEAGGPSPRLKPRPGCGRGPRSGLPAAPKVPRRPAGAQGPWWVSAPLGNKAGEAGAALDRAGAGPRVALGPGGALRRRIGGAAHKLRGGRLSRYWRGAGDPES